MAQNIYDDPAFFEGYSRLRRSQEGLDGAPEWPSMQALLPAMRGLRMVDLGCGFGWACRWAAAEGAESVLGLDISERMLARARRATPPANIEYRIADLESLALPAGSFEVAYSSLAFHYVVDLAGAFAMVARALVGGGRFVFSVEHPVYTAPSAPGWSVAGDGRRVWPLDRYLEEGPRTTDWLAPGVVKQHRLIGTYVDLLLGAGFTVKKVQEWSPSDHQLAQYPELAEERDRPMFVLFAADR